MYININESEFMQQFVDFDRADNFTRSALRELFAYYEQLEDGTNEPIEMDVIAICCDWAELDAEEMAREYGSAALKSAGDIESLVGRLEDETTVLTVEHHNAPDTYLVMAH